MVRWGVPDFRFVVVIDLEDRKNLREAYRELHRRMGAEFGNDWESTEEAYEDGDAIPTDEFDQARIDVLGKLPKPSAWGIPRRKPNALKQRLMPPGTRGTRASNSDARDDYMAFVINTLIQDLEDAGKYETAHDFEILVGFLEDDNLDEIFLKSTNQFWTVGDFMRYLEKTLIPDLKRSGARATAKDLETGLELLRRARS